MWAKRDPDSFLESGLFLWGSDCLAGKKRKVRGNNLEAGGIK